MIQILDSDLYIYNIFSIFSSRKFDQDDTLKSSDFSTFIINTLRKLQKNNKNQLFSCSSEKNGSRNLIFSQSNKYV